MKETRKRGKAYKASRLDRMRRTFRNKKKGASINRELTPIIPEINGSPIYLEDGDSIDLDDSIASQNSFSNIQHGLNGNISPTSDSGDTTIESMDSIGSIGSNVNDHTMSVGELDGYLSPNSSVNTTKDSSLGGKKRKSKRKSSKKRKRSNKRHNKK